MIQNDLFEDFCILPLKDTSLSTALFGTSNEELTIDSESLLASDEQFIPRFLEIAQTSISEKGPARFQDRERYLLETLGCYFCSTPGVKTTSESNSDLSI